MTKILIFLLQQVLQPMEAEPVAEEPQQQPPEPIAPEKLGESPEADNCNAAAAASTPSSVDDQPASEENTSENMEIEPPIETANHLSHAPPSGTVSVHQPSSSSSWSASHCHSVLNLILCRASHCILIPS